MTLSRNLLDLNAKMQILQILSHEFKDILEGGDNGPWEQRLGPQGQVEQFVSPLLESEDVANKRLQTLLENLNNILGIKVTREENPHIVNSRQDKNKYRVVVNTKSLNGIEQAGLDKLIKIIEIQQLMTQQAETLSKKQMNQDLMPINEARKKAYESHIKFCSKLLENLGVTPAEEKQSAVIVQKTKPQNAAEKIDLETALTVLDLFGVSTEQSTWERREPDFLVSPTFSSKGAAQTESNKINDIFKQMAIESASIVAPSRESEKFRVIINRDLFKTNLVNIVIHIKKLKTEADTSIAEFESFQKKTPGMASIFDSGEKLHLSQLRQTSKSCENFLAMLNPPQSLISEEPLRRKIGR